MMKMCYMQAGLMAGVNHTSLALPASLHAHLIL